MNVNSGKRTKSGRDTAVLKFSFFLFFIHTEPVIWLVVLCLFRNTKQSPLQILRTLGNWNLFTGNVGVAQQTKKSEDSWYEEHSDEQFIYRFCFFCRYI